MNLDELRRVSSPQPAIDTTVAHSPRIWNYWLGGKDNYEVDREIGDNSRTMFPPIVDIARSSRGFEAEIGIAVAVDEFGAVARKP